MWKVFFLLLFLTNANAAIPTIEGLFRNPSNPDLDGDMVALRVSIEELVSVSPGLIQKEVKESSINGAQVTELPEKGFYKFIFQKLTDSEKIKLLQVSYKSFSMTKSNLSNVVYYKDMEKKLNESSTLVKELFYSFLTMYGLNSSRGMNDILSRYGTNYTKNSELMNKDKVELMEKYKTFLTRLKNNEKEMKAKLKKNNGDTLEKAEFVSPMKPEGEDEIEKVKNILTQSMYDNHRSVSLARKSGKFYWEVQLENVNALFENLTHNLLFFKVQDKEFEIKSYFRNYILFDGRHQLPKIIEIHLSSGKSYRIRVLKYQNFHSQKSKTKKMSERFKQYIEMLEDPNKRDFKRKEAVFKKPIFIL